MRTYLFDLVLLSLISFTIVGCNKPEETAAKTELEGTWVKPCAADTTTSSNVTIVFAGSSMSFSGKNYSGTTCAGTFTSDTNTVYSISIGADSTTTSGSRNINVTLSSFSTTPRDAATASSYNTASLCGYNDWTINVAKDLTGRTCGSSTLPAAGSVTYTIYKLSGTSLQLGETSGSYDGTSEALRHQALQALTYTKQ